MRAYKIYLEDGTDYVTSMNATLEEAKTYFVGKYLNMGVVDDKMVKVIKVEEVTDDVNRSN
jgi:hypothetical protein